MKYFEKKHILGIIIVILLAAVILVPSLNRKEISKSRDRFSWLKDYEAEIDSLNRWSKPRMIGENPQSGLIAEYLAESPNMKICVRHGIKQSESLELTAVFLGIRTESFAARFQNLLFESGDEGGDVVFKWMYERGFFDKPGLPVRVKEILNNLRWADY